MGPRAVRLLALCALGFALLAPLSASAVAGPWLSGVVRDSDGAPLAGIQVRLWYLNISGEWQLPIPSLSTTSAANGAYGFSGFTYPRTYAAEFIDPAGQYVSEFYDSKPGAVASEATTIPITAAFDDVDWIHASLGLAGTITGTVRDSAGAPMPDIEVQAYAHLGGTSYGAMAARTVTGPNGTYSLAGLGGGAYALQFWPTLLPQYAPHYRSSMPTSGATQIANATPVGVTVGQTVASVDATMLKWSTVSGTVGFAGGPLSGVVIDPFRSEGGGWAFQLVARATSGGDGSFSTGAKLYPGTYRVRFDASTYPVQYHRTSIPIEFAADVVVAEDTTVMLEALLLAADGASPVSTTTPLPEGWVGDDVVASLSATDGADGSGVGAIYWRLDSSAATAYSMPVTISAEGAHDFGFWAVDRFGNVEPTNTVTVRIDKSPPLTQSDAPLVWRSGEVTVSLTASDALSGVASTLLGADGAAPSEYAGPLRVTKEGTTTLDFLSVDAVGNRETTRHATVRIDNTPPTTTASGFTDGAWRGNAANVTLTPVDPGGSGVGSTWYSVDGAPGSGTTFTVGGGGPHAIEYGSVDAVGNREVTCTATIRIDTTPPTTTPSGFVDGAWRNNSANVTLTPSDPGGSGVASTWYSVDGVPGSGTAFTVSGAGTHAIKWGSVDAVGNREGTCTASVRIDLTAPSTGAFITDDDPGTPEATVTLSVDEADSGTAATWYSINGLPAALYASAFAVTRGDIVAFHSEDVAGNVEGTGSVTVSPDSTPPTTTASGFTDGAWRNTAAAVVLTASDTGGWSVASTWYSVDGVPGSGTTFTVSGAGVHAVEYGSVDTAGNRESTRTATIRIDMITPVTSANPYPGAGAFTLSASDAGGSGLSGTWYSLDGGSWTPGTSLSASTGGHTVSFYSADNAGNQETPVGPVAFTVATPPAPPDPPVVTPVLTKASLLTRPYARAYTVYRYRSTAAWGYLKPRHTAGATSVTLQAYHYENGRWVRRATWLAKNSNFYSYTKYTRSIAFKTRGRWRVRAYHSDSRHAPTYSSYSYFTVR